MAGLFKVYCLSLEDTPFLNFPHIRDTTPILTIDPDVDLTGNECYRLDLTNYATDLARNPFDTFLYFLFHPIVFRASVTDDIDQPPVVSIEPSGTNVPISSTITVYFSILDYPPSEDVIDPGSINIANFQVLEGGVTPIPGTIEVAPDLASATFTPDNFLNYNTLYQVELNVASTGIIDLAGNAIPSDTAQFQTENFDDDPPVVDLLTINETEEIFTGNGQTPDVGFVFPIDGNLTTPCSVVYARDTVIAGRLGVPRTGFTIDVQYHDEGGAGIPPNTVSVGLEVVNPIFIDLRPFYTPTSTSAHLFVDQAVTPLPLGQITIRATIIDANSNTITKDIDLQVYDDDPAFIDRMLPFNTPQTVYLDFLRDRHSVEVVNYYDPPGLFRLLISDRDTIINGKPDFEEDLVLYGLRIDSDVDVAGNTVAGGTTLAMVPNTGLDTNEYVTKLVKARILQHLGNLFGITYNDKGEEVDREPNAPQLFFTLSLPPGQAPSPQTVYPPSTSIMRRDNPPNTVSPAEFTVYGFGGKADEHIDFAKVICPKGSSQANQDYQNDYEENNSEYVQAGILLGNSSTYNFCDAVNGDNPIRLSRKTFDPIIPRRGGVRIGTDPVDTKVLDPFFNRADPDNTQAEKDRYDEIMLAINRLARLEATIAAHEIGHSLGIDMGRYTDRFDPGNTYFPGNSVPPWVMYGGNPEYFPHYNIESEENLSPPPDYFFHCVDKVRSNGHLDLRIYEAAGMYEGYAANIMSTFSLGFEANINRGTGFTNFDKSYIFQNMVYERCYHQLSDPYPDFLCAVPAE